LPAGKRASSAKDDKIDPTFTSEIARLFVTHQTSNLKPNEGIVPRTYLLLFAKKDIFDVLPDYTL
jgi:hypothetical protein